MPRSYMQIVGRAATLVADAWEDSISEHSQAPVSVTDPALEVMHELVNGFQRGTSLSKLKERVQQLVTSQEQRAELVSRLVVAHDYARLVKFMSARSKLEDQLIQAAMRDNLSSGERLVLLSMVSSEADNIADKIRASSTDVRDVTSMLAKIDYTLQTDEKALSAKFKSTTPQGREVARRLALKLLAASGRHG